MRSRQETGANTENGSARLSGPPASLETAYDRLTAYGFARRYVAGKTVADIGREVGYGSSLLAETAESVAGLTGSSEAAERASATYPAPNVDYRRVNLPELPYPEDHFDAVVAFGTVEDLERPEDLIGEAKRVLKEDGVLIISVPDKLAHAYDRDHGGLNGRRGMYVPEFRELLERHFGDVRVYRQGAVAGGFVFPISGEAADATVEVARPSLDDPRFDAGLPIARSVIAVCGAAGILGQEEQPYLLLDRDRQVFDECEDRAEDVELLRDEIRQMQETEVQAFRDTIELRRHAAAQLDRYVFHLRNYRIHLRNIANGVNRKMSQSVYVFHLRNYRIHLRNIANGANRKISRSLSAAKDRNKHSD